MMLTKRLLSLGGAAIVLAGCGARAPEATSEASPAPGIVRQPAVAVRLVPVERRSLSGSVSASGEVIAQPGAQSNLAFPTAGRIASISVAVGDRVSEGSVLARLDDRIAVRDVAQAAADVNAGEAGLAKAEAGARPQELAQNRALVAGAAARARATHAEFRRQQSLAAVGIASRRDVEQARAADADAIAALSEKQQAGNLLVAALARKTSTSRAHNSNKYERPTRRPKRVRRCSRSSRLFAGS